MSDTKISGLAAGAPAQAGDLIPIARSGANYSITPANILAYGSSPVAGTTGAFSGLLSANASLAATGTMSATTGAAVGGATAGAGGLAFPATAVAVADANTLDDYEEGTCTFTYTCGTSGTITINPAFNTGRYTKVGNLVTVTGYTVNSAVSSPVGSLTLGGLPFASGNNNYNYSGFACYADSLSATAITYICGYVNKNASTALIRQYSAGAGANLAGNMTATSELAFCISYMIS